MRHHNQLKPHQFQKGNPGGPGRSKNWLKPSEIKDYIAKYCRMTVPQLAKFKHADETTVIEAILAGVLLRIVEEPDPSKLEFVLNRTVGRVVEAMEMESDDGNPIVRIVRADGSMLEVRPPEPKASAEPTE